MNWACYFYAVSWFHVSLGVHIDLRKPNIEIHLPFGFIRIGRVVLLDSEPILNDGHIGRSFGYDPNSTIR